MYKTSDLYLSAFLRANNFRIEKSEREHTKVLFYFEDTELLQKKILEFFNDGLVSVTRFKNAINDLKTLIYNSGV